MKEVSKHELQLPSSSHEHRSIVAEEQPPKKRMDVGQAGNNRGKFPPLQLISLQFVWPTEAVELKKYVVKFALKIDDTDNFISMSTWISNVDRLKFDSFAYKIREKKSFKRNNRFIIGLLIQNTINFDMHRNHKSFSVPLSPLNLFKVNTCGHHRHRNLTKKDLFGKRGGNE